MLLHNRALCALGIALFAPACLEMGPDDGAAYQADAGPGLNATLGSIVGKWQAEQATDTHCTDGDRSCPVRSRYAGYTGSGYVEYGDRGGYVEWSQVQVEEAGEYKLFFRYANGQSKNRPSTLYVNGTATSTLSFRFTGGWTRWRNQTVTVALREGTNTVRVQADSNAGGPSLDRLLVRVHDLCPGDPDKREPGECGCGNEETPDCGSDDPGGACEGDECTTACGDKYATPYDGDIILADDNKDAVFILDGTYRRNWNLSDDTRWRWDVSDARDENGRRLGSSFTGKFTRNKNDAKPVWFEDEMHILVVTNAGDGVALVRLSDKRVVFWKDLGSGGAHSAALLPDGNMVIADSQKKKDGRKHGAAIVLSTRTGKMQHCWQGGAHGSVWDHERQKMWVWGARSMVAYAYNGDRDDPQLLCGTAKKWGGVGPGGGHDLTPMMDGSRRLLFTASNGINWFDTRPGQEGWGEVDGSIGRGLKAVSYNPETGEYIYVKAESDSRSDDVRSRSNPPRTLSNGKWYKARWFVPNCFSWPDEETR